MPPIALSTFRLTAGLAAIAVVSAPAAAQYWRAEGATGFPPSARRGHVMAYLPTTQQVILYGGLDSGGLEDETWRLKNMQWSALPGNAGPQERQDSAMAYDPKREVLLVYGGRQTGSVFGYSDTWTFDGTDWELQSQSSNPGGRYGHAMAFDPVTERVVMFGGSNGASQTWVWDGTEWLASFTTTFPSPRRHHTMATDRSAGRVVLVGGTDGNTTFGDTWIWDGTTWSQNIAATLPPRSNHAMAYDVERQRIVVTGGTDGTTTLSSTYEYDGLSWQSVGGPADVPRRDLAIAYDESRGRIVMYGGVSTTYISNLQVNRPSGVEALTNTYGVGCGQPALELCPDAAARPVVGAQAGVLIESAPTTAAGLMIGWSDQMFAQYPLPVTLGILGMNGCDLLQSADVVGLRTQPLGLGVLSASTFVPNSQNLVGAHAYLQAYCFAPGANSMGIIVSNGVDWRIGAL